jgi:hypothetical protein
MNAADPLTYLILPLIVLAIVLTDRQVLRQ